MSNMLAFKEVMNKIVEKKFTPMIDRIYPMNEIRDAHEYIESRRQMGKVVVIP